MSPFGAHKLLESNLHLFRSVVSCFRLFSLLFAFCVFIEMASFWLPLHIGRLHKPDNIQCHTKYFLPKMLLGRISFFIPFSAPLVFRTALKYDSAGNCNTNFSAYCNFSEHGMWKVLANANNVIAATHTRAQMVRPHRNGCEPPACPQHCRFVRFSIGTICWYNFFTKTWYV